MPLLYIFEHGSLPFHPNIFLELQLYMDNSKTNDMAFHISVCSNTFELANNLSIWSLIPNNNYFVQPLSF